MNRLALAAFVIAPLLVACPPGPDGTPDSGTPDAGTAEAPRLIGISPTEGLVAGGTVVLVTGDFFQEGAKVFFGPVAAETTFNSAKRLSARTPAAGGEGTVTVRVENPDGKLARLENAFTYVLAPAKTIAEAKLFGEPLFRHQTGTDPAVIEIAADVEVAEVTAGAGQGEGVQAQIGYVVGGPGVTLAELTWSDATYASDVDGATQGDLSRDRYQGQVSVPGAAGTEVKTYLVAARFSADGGKTWTVADLDGASNGATVEQLRKVEVSQNLVDWCKLGGVAAETPPQITLKVGQAGPLLFAQLYEAGVTDGSGQGAGLKVELGHGQHGSDPRTAQWTWAPAGFNVDQGNNDEYKATLPNPGEGSYAFTFRVAVGAGPWRYCDANGSGPDSEFEVDQTGKLTVATGVVDRCKLHYPATLQTRSGVVSSKVYGWAWAAGVTDAAGQGPGVTAELGYGPANTAPDTAGWTWTAATYNAADGDKDNGAADEYEATITGPAAGNYHYAYRFSLGAGTRVYCDLDGSDAAGFTSDQAGVMTAKALGVDTCQLMGPASYQILTGAATPGIPGQVTALTITEGLGAGPGITAEVGYGAAGTQPSTWTWVGANFSGDQNQGASDEYRAALTPAASGTYKVAYRFRYQSDPPVYCDLDGSANGFDEAQAATLTVGAAACTLVGVTKAGATAPVTTAPSGAHLEAKASVLIPGVTSTPGAAPNLIGQVGVGTEGTDASSDPAWGWKDAAFDSDVSGTGEEIWKVTFDAAYTGNRAVSFRFSTDNRQTWSYCDLDGPSNGYSAAQQSALAVAKPDSTVVEAVDYCILQWPATLPQGTAWQLYGRVYEAAVTEGPGTQGSIEAQWGWGKKVQDPGVAWTWQPATFNVEIGSNSNNDEYSATFSGVPAGTHHYAMRFRRPGATNPWCYGDLNGSGANTGLSGFNGETETGGENLGVATVP